MSSTGAQRPRNPESPPGRPQPRDNGPTDSKGPPPKRMMPPLRTWGWFILAVAINYLLVRYLLPSSAAPVAVPYTLFKEEVQRDNVKAIYSQGETITGKFSSPVTYPPASSGSQPNVAPNGQPKKVTSFKTILPT